MRYVLAFLCLATPAAAWEFSVTTKCHLDHVEAGAEMGLTYDPVTGLYSITVTRDTPWPAGPLFAMQFNGPRPIFIQTDRHMTSEDGRSLTVVDQGFGNVLNGLEFNTVAVAMLADTAVGVSLFGAADEVAAFRACTEAGLA